MRGVVVEQRLLELRELEEVVLLGDALDRAVVDRTQPVDELVLGVIRLTGDAVQALVGGQLDEAVVVDLLQERLDRGPVAVLGGADEVVVADVEQLSTPRGTAALVTSAHSWGVTPRSSAARWILRPCSSVPVRNSTSSPWRRRQRARTSAWTVVYACPMCGASFT